MGIAEEVLRIQRAEEFRKGAEERVAKMSQEEIDRLTPAVEWVRGEIARVKGEQPVD